MKKMYLVFTVLFMAVMVSCSSGGDSKKVSSFDEEISSEPIESSEESSNETFSTSDTPDTSEVSEAPETPDWDELLDSYEQFVDQYISLVKKASKGDLTAIAEYPSVMKKATEFAEKMKGAQSDMSSSQWARYMEITNKMSKAALELRQ